MADPKGVSAKETGVKEMGAKEMSKGQRAYEERQAKKAGKSLDAWLAEKRKQRADAARPPAPPPAPKKPGLLSRLLDRAHKPL